jgi:methylase of polypeptide subunit release factors
MSALTDNSDGLTFYRHLAEHFHKLVRQNGYMVLETGNGDHPHKALKIFRKYGINTELKKDYSGNYRVLIAHTK